MHMLTRRLQVLIDEERYERLKREAEAAGAPVGELVRRAIDREYPTGDDNRGAAGARLLELPPPSGEGPEPDWEVQKREMLDGRGA